jgi:transaldolase
MQIFLDTAHVADIAQGAATGCITGVTTNPTIVSREGKPLRQCIRDIAAVDPGLTILVEAVSAAPDDLVAEAHRLVELAPSVVIKLPMGIAGLAAARRLSREGIRTTITLVFSLAQAVACSCAGADYVAPFVGRLDDINARGIDLVRSIRETFRIQGAATRIIAASVRSVQSVTELFQAGCDVVTMPYAVFQKMLEHPLTEAGLRQFEKDWKSVPAEKQGG